MRKFTWLFAMILFLGVKAIAQDAPKVEVFGGYSHFLSDISNTSSHLGGGGVAVTENLNNWFGGTIDVGAQWGVQNGFNVNTQQFMYGPAVAYRQRSPFTPFGHILLGAIRGSQGFAGISQSAIKIAAAFGGGVDLKISKQVSIRAIQADYLMSRFMNTRQNNLRLSAGLVLKFGAAR
jgi:hypothetical protein